MWVVSRGALDKYCRQSKSIIQFSKYQWQCCLMSITVDINKVITANDDDDDDADNGQFNNNN